MYRSIRSIGTMVAALAWMGANPAFSATLTLGSGSGAPGTQVSIPVSYDGTAAATRIEFTVALNQSSPVGAPPLAADPVPKPGTAPIVDLNTYDGVSATGLAEAVKGVLNAGDLMTITLTIPDSAPEGTVYSLALSNLSSAGAASRGTVLKGVGGTLSVKGQKVQPPFLSTLSVVPGTSTLTIGGSQTFQAMGADATGKPFAVEPGASSPIAWQVDRTDLAKIDASGELVALQPGTVKVTATFEKVAGTATVTIVGPEGKAPDDVVSIGSLSARPGDQVDLPLILTGPAGLSDLDLSLDLTNSTGSPLKIVGIKTGGTIGSTVLPSPMNNNVDLIVLVAGDTALAPGTVATLTVGIPGDAKGSYSLNPIVVSAHDPAGNEFVLPSKPGIVTISTPPPTVRKGDANGDGVVDIRDATATLRVAVALDQPTSTQKMAMDVNGDGTIDIRDVVLILQFVVGLIKTL